MAEDGWNSSKQLTRLRSKSVSTSGFPVAHRPSWNDLRSAPNITDALTLEERKHISPPKLRFFRLVSDWFQTGFRLASDWFQASFRLVQIISNWFPTGFISVWFRTGFRLVSGGSHCWKKNPRVLGAYLFSENHGFWRPTPETPPIPSTLERQWNVQGWGERSENCWRKKLTLLGPQKKAKLLQISANPKGRRSNRMFRFSGIGDGHAW